MDQDPYSMNVPEPVPPASPTFNSNPIDGRSWIANARKALMNAIPNADTSTPSSSSTQQHVPMRPPQAPPPPGKPKSAKERPKVQTITYERYNMMKPALLEEMKSHIQRGLSSIEHNTSDKDINDELTTRLRTLNVHREAFQKFFIIFAEVSERLRTSMQEGSHKFLRGGSEPDSTFPHAAKKHV